MVKLAMGKSNYSPFKDELTTEDADILNNYNMICHEKKDNNYIIIQKDTLFYLLPL